MKIKTLLALFLGATLILAACGDSDDGGSGGGGESDPAR